MADPLFQALMAAKEDPTERIMAYVGYAPVSQNYAWYPGKMIPIIINNKAYIPVPGVAALKGDELKRFLASTLGITKERSPDMESFLATAGNLGLLEKQLIKLPEKVEQQVFDGGTPAPFTNELPDLGTYEPGLAGTTSNIVRMVDPRTGKIIYVNVGSSTQQNPYLGGSFLFR